METYTRILQNGSVPVFWYLYCFSDLMDVKITPSLLVFVH